MYRNRIRTISLYLLCSIAAGCSANKVKPSQEAVNEALATARTDAAVLYGQGEGFDGFVEYVASPFAAKDLDLVEISDPDAILEKTGRKYVIKPGTYTLEILCNIRDGALLPRSAFNIRTRTATLNAGEVYQLDGKLRDDGKTLTTNCDPFVRNLNNWARHNLRVK